MIPYILIIILIAIAAYLHAKIKKLENTTPKVKVMPDGSYSLIYKDKEIYNAKPSDQ